MLKLLLSNVYVEDVVKSYVPEAAQLRNLVLHKVDFGELHQRSLLPVSMCIRSF